MGAEPGDDSPAGGGDGRAGLAIPGGSPHFDARGGMGGNCCRERGQVFRRETIGADNGREGSGFEGNDSVDNGLEGDKR